ncbi:hypothetical protein COV16_01835 [Candidatus Woesearchaeota archaeon CG10_big_fil_rev_8_21_14_0_10_34_8]|nr:MAG: hypothetical protein COV16_01835 [Candidatus Woesearchaeota archaeon CG10_big_fil_rev_8_21_14_0_10_34_8]
MAAKQKKEASRAARASAKAARQKRLVKKTSLTKKKKTWHSIVAPDIFGKAQIGESLIDEPSILMGKTVQLSLMTLTGDMKKQNITIKFAVDNIKENRGHTRVLSYNIVPASIKRMVRRGRSRIDASIVCKSKDNVKIRIKPFILTLNLTNRATATRIRNHVVTFLATYITNKDYNTVFKEVVSGKLQMYMTYVARKVYLVKTCGIRTVEVVKDDINTTVVPQENLDIEKLIKAAETAPRPKYPKPPRQKFDRRTTLTQRRKKKKRR